MKIKNILFGMFLTIVLLQNANAENETSVGYRADWIYKIPIDILKPETSLKGSYSAFSLANINGYFFINPKKANYIQPAIVDNYLESNNNFYAIDIKYDRLLTSMLVEMQYMRKELCRLNNSYGFCLTPTLADKIVSESTDKIIYSKDYYNTK